MITHKPVYQGSRRALWQDGRELGPKILRQVLAGLFGAPAQVAYTRHQLAQGLSLHQSMLTKSVRSFDRDPEIDAVS